MWKKFKTKIRQFFEVYCHEFKLVISDPGIIIFLAFLPIGYPVIYSLIYNPEVVRDIGVVVVDHDRSQQSRELARKVDATQAAWVKGYAADMHEARRAMDGRDCYAILEIPQGFGRDIGRGTQADVVMYCDMSLLLRYRSLLIGTSGVARAMGAELTAQKIDLTLPLAATLAPDDLMPMNYVAMGNTVSGFDSFIMPGVLMLILQQSICLAVGMAGGAKRSDPNLIRYNAVNQRGSIMTSMLGQMACYTTVMILPILFLCHYVPLMFSFPMAGDTFQILLFLVPMLLASICLGFCVQALVTEREMVFVVWVITTMPFLFLSGLTWPRYSMHGIWRAMSDCVPATWGIEGFIKMNSNGSTLAQVAGDYLNLWICFAAYFVLAYILQRWVVHPQLWNMATGKTPLRRNA